MAGRAQFKCETLQRCKMLYAFHVHRQQPRGKKTWFQLNYYEMKQTVNEQMSGFGIVW